MPKDTRKVQKTLSRRLGDGLDTALSVLAPAMALKRQAARRFLDAAYRGAEGGRTRRSRAQRGGSEDLHTPNATLIDLRSTCQDQYRNSAFTKGLLEAFVNNVWGNGFRLQAQSDDEPWNQQVEERWARWGERECDVRGIQTFDDMCRSALYAPLRDGDCGFIQVAGGHLQPVEAENIASPSHSKQTQIAKSHKITNGVELSAKGRPVAYWVAPYKNGRAATELAKRISAQHFLHVYRPFRFSQSRGVPELHAILDDLERMDEYMEASLMAAQVAACFGLVVETDQPSDVQLATGEEGVNKQDEPQLLEELEPAMVYYLQKGEKVTQVDPKIPPSQLPDFVLTLARFAMFSLGMPLELFDPSQTNYSSGRLALLQGYRMFRQRQIWARDRLLAKVYRWKVSQWMKYEDLPQRQDAWNHSWVLPGWEWVDPLKEVAAAMKAIDRGLSSIPDECAARGKDWQQVLNDNARAIRRAKEVAEKEGVDWRELINVPSTKSNMRAA